jgi:outer membrane murein-binding lipoprotein Lpp
VTAAAAVVVAVVVAVLVSRAARRRWQAQLDAARADVEALTARVDDLVDHRAPAETATKAAREPVPGPPEFVITSLPDGTVPRHADLEVARPAGAQLTAGQFASVAVGESLVRVLSFGYGVRRALSAENRNRIRFEMRREVKHARRQRRRDLKEAKRHLRQVTGESREGAA